MERRKAGTKNKEVPPAYHSLPNQNALIIKIRWYYFIRNENKYNEIQLTINKMERKLLKK